MYVAIWCGFLNRILETIQGIQQTTLREIQPGEHEVVGRFLRFCFDGLFCFLHRWRKISFIHGDFEAIFVMLRRLRKTLRNLWIKINCLSIWTAKAWLETTTFRPRDNRTLLQELMKKPVEQLHSAESRSDGH